MRHILKPSLISKLSFPHCLLAVATKLVVERTTRYVDRVLLFDISIKHLLDKAGKDNVSKINQAINHRIKICFSIATQLPPIWKIP